MNDLNTLRPEVREAVQELDSKAYPGSRTHEHWLTIRAELLHLNSETDRLHKVACQQLRAKQKAEAELAEMKQTFDLRWKADMRAIEQWRVAHPGSELVMPDHADMCVWLMSELAAVKARISQGIVLDVDDLARGHAGLPSEWRGQRVRLVVEE